MFVWKVEFELGIPSIDNQHKNLLRIGNQLYSLLDLQMDKADNFKEVLDIIYELKAYTKYHFQTEEDLFLKYKYPEVEQHKREHQGFINYLDSINLLEHQGNYTSIMKELLTTIINWVFNHIITSDYLYKDYLIQLGAK